MLPILEIARSAAAGCVVALGLMLALAGAVGILRFPDVYTRLHAANVSNGLAPALTIAGLAIAAPDMGLAARLLLLALLVLLFSPISAHFIAGAAHAAGLTPLNGVSREDRAS